MKKIGLTAILKNEWPILVMFFVFFAISVAIFPWLNNTEYQMAMKKAEDKSAIVKQSLDLEEAAALEQAKEITEEQDINSAIARNDIFTLPALLANEAKKRNLSFLAAVNGFGVNLADIPLTSNRGDYIFQTTAWGRIVARGKEVSTIGTGKVYPLVLLGGEPIINNLKLGGAVFAGNLLNDDYARKFKAKYVSNGTQFMFYSKDDGPLGSSFPNPDDTALLNSYFSVGTDWIQREQTGKVIKLNEETYFVKNYVLTDSEDPQKITGGVLIFLPFNLVNRDFFASSLIALIFLLCEILAHAKFHKTNHKKLIISLSIFLSLLLLGATLYFSLTEFTRQTMIIKKPPFTIYNSTLKFEPDNNVIDQSSEQRIAIKVATGGEAINALTVEVDFDPAQAKVLDILTENSFCRPDLFVEKSIDNDTGKVMITCGLPSPGFNGGEGVVAELLLQPLKIGDFALHFGPSTSVIANDGLGTDVLRQSTDASYRVANFELQTAQNGQVPPAVQIFSSSHPNSERWYNQRAINFSWPPYQGYQYFYLFDKNPNSIPRGEFSTTENELNLSAKDDGIYYLHVVAFKDGQAGPVSSYKVKIDATIPLPPLILASKTTAEIGEIIRFKFAGSDDLSGLQKGFYVKIDNSILFPVLPQLDIPFYDPGRHIITLRVFDNAGNYRDSILEISILNH